MSAKETRTDEHGSIRPDRSVVLVHRAGAILVAAVILVFGVLGFAGGLDFFDTSGQPVLGMSTNGALSTVSVVTAAVLLAAAVRGGRLASTVMIVVGALFFVSAFVNLGLMHTSLNVLAFRLPNVFFSLGAGLLLLTVGAYGRLAGTLPDDNPYRLEQGHGPHRRDPEDHQPRPESDADVAVDAEIAEAERVVAAGGGDDELRRRVAELGEVREHEQRRARWRSTAHGV